MLDKEGLTQEVSVGVTYASLMSAVALFFTGVLIAQYTSFDVSIRVPLVLLIISTFSFIFAATIFSNAATELTVNKLHNVQRYMVYAKNIDELLGLYLFILATPMVLGAVTKDGFLRGVTIAVALVGFTLYSQSKFSVFDDELTPLRKRFFSSLIVVLSFLLYVFQGSHMRRAVDIFAMLALVLVLLLVGLTYAFCKNGKQYNVSTFRHYEDDDADEIAELILSNLRHVKPKTMPKEIIAEKSKLAEPDTIRKLAADKSVTVAEFKGRVAGFAVRDGHKIEEVFTDPDLHRKGIGRQLVAHLEEEIRGDGFKVATHLSTAVDRDFYLRIGYHIESESTQHALGHVYHMQRKLR